jgi:hypothetical protein
VVAHAGLGVRVEEPVREVLQVDGPARHGGLLLSESAPDLPDRAKESDAKVFDGNVQVRGDVARRDAVDQVEDERRALLGVSRLEGAADPREVVLCSRAWSGRRTSTSGAGVRAAWRTLRRRRPSRMTLAAMVKTQCSKGAVGR